MTHPCKKEGCPLQVADNYEYCYNHFKEQHMSDTPQGQTETMQRTPPKQWHDDPVVDQLMKINHNLGKIATYLEAMTPRM